MECTVNRHTLVVTVELSKNFFGDWCCPDEMDVKIFFLFEE
jgi:hypothetical protein